MYSHYKTEKWKEWPKKALVEEILSKLSIKRGERDTHRGRDCVCMYGNLDEGDRGEWLKGTNLGEIRSKGTLVRKA